MDVWHRVLDLAALANGPELLSLGHRCAPRDADRAEMEQRDRVSIGRLDRDRAPVPREAPGKARVAGGGRQHRLPGGPSDVYAAVLTGLVLTRRD
jgi:hypothetical protein